MISFWFSSTNKLPYISGISYKKDFPKGTTNKKFKK
jgi:hypothetical protein